MSNIKVKVERAAYERNDKSYFAYFIRGNIRGRDIRVLIVPPDNGGYRVLDIVSTKTWKRILSSDLLKLKTRRQAGSYAATVTPYKVRTKTAKFMNAL